MSTMVGGLDSGTARLYDAATQQEGPDAQPCRRRRDTGPVILIRFAGLFFALVQISLVLRLALPFVEVPESLEDFVPPLMDLTGLWLLPVEAIVERFEVSGAAAELSVVADGTVSGPEAFEPLVLVAMLFWAIAAWFVLFVLRLIIRPAGS